MRYNTKINYQKTKEYYGYSIKSKKPSKGSTFPIIVECTNCNKLIHREYRNAFRQHQCSIVHGRNKKCFKCKTWKSLGKFNKNSQLSGKVAKMCRECHNKHPSVILCEYNRRQRLRTAFDSGNLNLYFTKKISSIKNNCKRNNVKFDLTVKNIMDLWNKQQGKCYYSNIPMSNSMKQLGFQAWDSPSIDRLEPNKGYVVDNIVWCIFAVNSFKSSLTEKQFKSKLKEIIWNL